MSFEDTAEKLQDLYHAVVTAGAYDATAKTFTSAVAGALAVTSDLTVGGNATVTGHFGCNGQTAQAKSSPYTLTYSTQARTVPVATAASVATTASTQTTPWGFSSQAQADAIPVAINALEADVLALKKVIVSLVADLQANGIAG